MKKLLKEKETKMLMDLLDGLEQLYYRFNSNSELAEAGNLLDKTLSDVGFNTNLLKMKMINNE